MRTTTTSKPVARMSLDEIDDLKRALALARECGFTSLISALERDVREAMPHGGPLLSARSCVGAGPVSRG
jgi:hypothetical protein